MDVLFIDPPWIIESDSNLWKTVGSCLSSLGIAYIASYLQKQGYKVPIFYYPRTIERGKKINWRDGIVAIFTLLKYGFVD